MPLYTFQSTTGETKDVFVSLKEPDEKRRLHVDAEGVEWKRVIQAPMMNVDTQIDPFSEKQFREKTANKRGETVGDAWDRSKEMSEQRAAKLGGKDPVRERFFNDYKKRKKVPHTAQLAEGQKEAREHLDKGLKDLGIKITPQIGSLGKLS